LTGRHDLSAGPFRGEMLQIASHNAVGVGVRGLGALQKSIVIGVGTSMHLLGRFDPESILSNSAQRGFNYRLAAVKLGTPEHFLVFGIDIAATQSFAVIR
jgi:hypothetical protein